MFQVEFVLSPAYYAQLCVVLCVLDRSLVAKCQGMPGAKKPFRRKTLEQGQGCAGVQEETVSRQRCASTVIQVLKNEWGWALSTSATHLARRAADHTVRASWGKNRTTCEVENLNLIKPPTSNSQEIQRAEKRVKEHHEDATAQPRLWELYVQDEQPSCKEKQDDRGGEGTYRSKNT